MYVGLRTLLVASYLLRQVDVRIHLLRLQRIIVALGMAFIVAIVLQCDPIDAF